MKSTTLTALKEFPRHLEAYFAAIPAGFENWRPDSWVGIPSEPFTAIEQICHVRDVEIEGYHVRFLRTLQESNPSLPDLAGEALARERSYAAADPEQVLATFREARARSVALISGLTDAELARVAEFDGVPTTLRALVHYRIARRPKITQCCFAAVRRALSWPAVSCATDMAFRTTLPGRIQAYCLDAASPIRRRCNARFSRSALAA
jgi:hypothetical protein